MPEPPTVISTVAVAAEIDLGLYPSDFACETTEDLFYGCIDEKFVCGKVVVDTLVICDIRYVSIRTERPDPSKS